MRLIAAGLSFVTNAGDGDVDFGDFGPAPPARMSPLRMATMGSRTEPSLLESARAVHDGGISRRAITADEFRSRDVSKDISPAAVPWNGQCRW